MIHFSNNKKGTKRNIKMTMKMKKTWLPFLVTIVVIACNNKGNGNAVYDQQPKYKTYECEQFSVSYPCDYYFKQEAYNTGVKLLRFGKDSLFEEMTEVLWEAPGYYPGTVKEFVSLFVYKELKEHEKAGKFYHVLLSDSIIKVDGRPSYSISSMFSEKGDTILISRTGLIIPNMMDMMITQRVKIKSPREEILPLLDILDAIRIKKK